MPYGSELIARWDGTLLGGMSVKVENQVRTVNRRMLRAHPCRVSRQTSRDIGGMTHIIRTILTAQNIHRPYHWDALRQAQGIRRVGLP